MNTATAVAMNGNQNAGVPDAVEMASGGEASTTAIRTATNGNSVWNYIGYGLILLTGASLIYSVVYYHKSLAKMQKGDTDLKAEIESLKGEVTSLRNTSKIKAKTRF
jgi:hypothetical protein